MDDLSFLDYVKITIAVIFIAIFVPIFFWHYTVYISPPKENEYILNGKFISIEEDKKYFYFEVEEKGKNNFIRVTKEYYEKAEIGDTVILAFPKSYGLFEIDIINNGGYEE